MHSQATEPRDYFVICCQSQRRRHRVPSLPSLLCPAARIRPVVPVRFPVSISLPTKIHVPAINALVVSISGYKYRRCAEGGGVGNKRRGANARSRRMTRVARTWPKERQHRVTPRSPARPGLRRLMNAPITIVASGCRARALYFVVINERKRHLTASRSAYVMSVSIVCSIMPLAGTKPPH